MLDRDSHTGLLSLVDVLEDDVGGINGLGFPIDIVFSPDDQHVYVTSGENSLVVFARDPEDGGGLTSRR